MARSAKPIRIDPLTSVICKAEFVWGMGGKAAGFSSLVIKVTNLWVNRLIGDQQPGVTKKITYTTMPFYNAHSSLLPSGLLGPVQILSRSGKGNH